MQDEKNIAKVLLLP